MYERCAYPGINGQTNGQKSNSFSLGLHKKHQAHEQHCLSLGHLLNDLKNLAALALPLCPLDAHEEGVVICCASVIGDLQLIKILFIYLYLFFENFMHALKAS